MALLIVAPNRDTAAVEAHLRQLEATLDIRIWPAMGAVDDIDFAVLWKHPHGLLAELPALRAVSSYGAGVESILSDPSLPPELPVGRISGPRLAADMAEFVAAVVINQHRGLWGFFSDQQQQQWRPWAPLATPIIGLLGAGKMANACAQVFRALGYRTHQWGRQAKPGQADYHHGNDGLNVMLAQVNYLVCLLPLTPDTQGILNAKLFGQLQTGTYLINVGRGDHLVEDDLIPALNSGQLSGAYLDVFHQEPLPGGHPFWSHPKIKISPHCASFTLPEEAARLIWESYSRVRRGELPLDVIQRHQGY